MRTNEMNATKQGGTMKELAFRYDIETDDWIECQSEMFVHEDIEKLPCAIYLDFKGVLVQTEKVLLNKGKGLFPWLHSDKGMPILPSGERIDALIVKADATESFDRSAEISSAIGRWRIYVKGSRITVSADIAKMRLVSNHSNEQMPYLPRIRWQYVSMNIDADKWESALFPAGLGRNKDIEIKVKDNQYTYIPKNVCRSVQALLQERMRVTTGIYPTIMMEKDYGHQLTAFIERPYDLNITFLKKFVGEDVYENMFPRDQKDNYRPLCKYLDIKPPKSLRKAYALNPYSIIIYLMLKQLGFTDINLIRRMFGYDYIGCYPVRDLIYSKEEERVVVGIADNRISIVKIEEIFKRLLADGNEMSCIKILCDLSSGNWQDWQRDSIEMYAQCYNYLSLQLRQKIAHEGFTESIHDDLVEVLNYYGLDITEVRIIRYKPQYLNLECNINGYDIALVHRQSELGKIGKALHNCVASYENRVGTDRCMIISVRFEGKYVACIEIDKSRIIQAKGFANSDLDGELRIVLNYWAKENHLLDPQNTLVIKENVTDYVFNVTRGIHAKTIADMTLQEFLEMPDENAEKIKSDYLAILDEKMREQSNVKRVAPPPWMRFNDEAAYLRYVIPWAERLIQSGEENDKQAVEIIGKMFLEGKFLPRDLRRADYWFAKDGVAEERQVLKRKIWKSTALGNREEALLYRTQLLRSNHLDSMSQLEAM